MTSAEDYEGPGYNPCSEGECSHYHCDNSDCQRIMPEATESGVCQLCELKWQAAHMLMDSPTAAMLMPHTLTSNETGDTNLSPNNLPVPVLAEPQTDETNGTIGLRGEARESIRVTDLAESRNARHQDSCGGQSSLQQTAEKELIGIAGFFEHMNGYFERKP